MHALSSFRDALWPQWTCPLGWPVIGIWRSEYDLTDINAVCQTSALAGSSGEPCIAVADDLHRIFLYRFPSSCAGAEGLEHSGHASPVTNVRFSSNNLLISLGGSDHTVQQWSLVREGGQYTLSSRSGSRPPLAGAEAHARLPQSRQPSRQGWPPPARAPSREAPKGPRQDQPARGQTERVMAMTGGATAPGLTFAQPHVSDEDEAASTRAVLQQLGQGARNRSTQFAPASRQHALRHSRPSSAPVAERRGLPGAAAVVASEVKAKHPALTGSDGGFSLQTSSDDAEPVDLGGSSMFVETSALARPLSDVWEQPRSAIHSRRSLTPAAAECRRIAQRGRRY